MLDPAFGLGFGFVFTFGLFLVGVIKEQDALCVFMYLISAAILMGRILSRLLGS
jgi:hypothetical protein